MIIEIINTGNHYYLHLPNSYSLISKNNIFNDFMEWIEDQKDCIVNINGNLGYCFDENDFLKFVNEKILINSNEKAYFIRNPHKKSDFKLVL